MNDIRTAERLRVIDESVRYLQRRLVEQRNNRVMKNVILDKLWTLHRKRQYVLAGKEMPQ